MNRTDQVHDLMVKSAKPISIRFIAENLGWTDDEAKAVVLNLRKTGRAKRADVPVLATYAATRDRVAAPRIVKSSPSIQMVEREIRSQPNSVWALGGAA